MGVTNTVSVLQNMPLFRDIDPQRLRVVAMVGRIVAYRDGEVLFRRGEEGDAAYVVLKGSVDVLIPGPAGDRKVAELGQGELFGEIAVLCDKPRTSTIAAHGDVEVLHLERDVLRNLMKDLPDLGAKMIRLLASRLETTTLALAEARAGVGS